MRSRGEPGVSRCPGNVADAWRGRSTAEFCGKGMGAVTAFAAPASCPARLSSRPRARPESREVLADVRTLALPSLRTYPHVRADTRDPCHLHRGHPRLDRGAIGAPSGCEGPDACGWRGPHRRRRTGPAMQAAAILSPWLRDQMGPGSRLRPARDDGRRGAHAVLNAALRSPWRLRMRGRRPSIRPRSCVHRSARPRGPCRVARVAAPAPP